MVKKDMCTADTSPLFCLLLRCINMTYVTGATSGDPAWSCACAMNCSYNYKLSEIKNRLLDILTLTFKSSFEGCIYIQARPMRLPCQSFSL